LGWLDRADNFWFLTFPGAKSKVQHDLFAIDDRAITRVARFYAAVTPLVTGGGPSK
jgi:hypothetical protein